MPKRTIIIDADKAAGPCNMSYDDELAEFEAIERHAPVGGYNAFPMPSQHMSLPSGASPIEMEREADRFLQEALDSVR